MEKFNIEITNPNIKAAGILVITSDGKVLSFVSKKRGNTTEMPCGKREKGEHPFITAQREFAEETGWELKLKDNSTYFIYPSDDFPENFCVAYIVRLEKSSNEILIPEHSGDSDGSAEWMTPSQFIARTSFPD